MIHYLEKKEYFDKIINNKKITIVDFSSKTCGPCIMLEPVLVDFANDKDFNLIIVDVKLMPEFSQSHQISATPTIKIYKNSQLLDTFSGYKSYEELEVLFENIN